MNNFPVMTEEQRQELIRHNRAKVNAITPQFLKESTPGFKKHLQREIDSAKIALAALTRDNAKLAREIVYRLVDVGAADPDVFDSSQAWVLKKLNGVKS